MKRLGGLIAGAALLAAFASCEAATCTVSTTSVAFGSYDTLSTTANDSTGTVTVSCDASTSYSIAINGGASSSFARYMTSGANQMNYNLFTDATRSTIWGDGTGSTSQVSHTGTGATDTIYGRIPARQIIQAGSYADSLVVTITY